MLTHLSQVDKWSCVIEFNCPPYLDNYSITFGKKKIIIRFTSPLNIILGSINDPSLNKKGEKICNLIFIFYLIIRLWVSKVKDYIAICDHYLCTGPFMKTFRQELGTLTKGQFTKLIQGGS
ncbi:hypothetical protein M0813_07667 [Anaeramoeba flamelloides]|uniref:Uncharacterized protein n=1 Tax=Anaeramoeba flamelloides TaxID=1746091 RepID=A0ABQ8XAL5_9EUKA|nr:hypothetical protein M0813_07667 [Anaeramoeba flamelloides]